MASFVYLDAYILVNAVNLSDHNTSVTLKGTADVKENTAMGSSWKTKLTGLKDFSVDVQFNQDFAVGSIDATLWAIFNAGTAVAIEVRPTSGAASTTNPKWTGNIIVPEYVPIDGGVGDLASTKLTLEGTGVLARATS